MIWIPLRFLLSDSDLISIVISNLYQRIDLDSNTVMFFAMRFLFRRQLSSSSADLYTQLKLLNSANKYRQSISLFDRHVQSEKKITNGAICQALTACIEMNDMKRGKQIHENLSPGSMKDTFILANLIRLYMKSGDVQQAKEMFFTSPQKTIGMYNAVLSGLSKNNRADEALSLFQQSSIPPNATTFTILFKICSQIGDEKALQYGKMMYETMPEIHRSSPYVSTSALKMLMQSGDIASAEKLFSQMKKDMQAYGVMMSGYLENKRPQQAIDLFLQLDKPDQINFFIFFNACAQMGTKEALNIGKKIFLRMPKEYQQSNTKNKILYALLNMFIRCNDQENAENLFLRLNRDVMSYGAMMKMYNENNEPEKTMSLVEQMTREKIKPDAIIYLMMINACAQLGDLSLCQSTIAKVPQNVLTERYIQNALIDMWGKSGSTEQAKEIFARILKPDIISFSAMINAYGLNGMGIQAVELFHQIPKERLDEWTYVCVLNACSHSGLIDQARSIFENIPMERRTEQIYTAMVDAYSRSYWIDEAERLIEQYEKNNSPTYPMYMALLSAARNDRNISLAQKIVDHIQTKFPDNEDCLVSATVLLANTYSLSGNMSMASQIRWKLSQTGMKRKGGISSTVVNGEIVQFRAHDRSHPRSEDIYAELDRLSFELGNMGHVPDSSWITRPATEDESEESLLCGHSERLAIAYNLIQKPTPTRIQITKNLRVCGDCHQTIKLIAQLRQCLIIVRDANRVHHFHPNGKCSCQEHF